LRGFPHATFVEGLDHLSLVVQAFGNLFRARLRDEERGLAKEWIEQLARLGSHPAAGLINRAKAAGDQKPGTHPGALKNRVGGHRGAVHQESDVARRQSLAEQLVQGVDPCLGWACREEGTLMVCSFPELCSKATRSVKVPPVSTP